MRIASLERSTRAWLMASEREQHTKIALPWLVTSAWLANKDKDRMRVRVIRPTLLSRKLILPRSEGVAGSSTSPPDHLIGRWVTFASRSTTSFIIETITLSPAWPWNERWPPSLMSSASVSACFSSARSVPSRSWRKASPDGLMMLISSSRWSMKWRAPSYVKPESAICMMTIGISMRVASRSSRRHHGRVSTPLVASSSSVSLSCTPSVMRPRRSLSVDESRNTGTASIFRSMSWMYRASEPASIL
mmetsp:Transcript_27090/g.65381  ORF Transcript_27090/g.65381 Transcript_27090/m.65381 type:complete len:247 (-) Transcript_27090:2949-3689(-)